MRYVSTRGEAATLNFEDVVLTGLARDGGLYVPAEWPHFDEASIADLAGRPYPEVAVALMWPFVEGAIPRAAFAEMVREAYAGFDHPDVAPLRPLGADEWLLELFHGPTLAFKDFALQLLGRLFDYFLARRGERATIVGATSGDTGSAAIAGCRGLARLDIFILHPRGRISEVQRRQMTTIADANVFNIALEGTFDDCQALVKAMFNDAPFRDRLRLTAVNSINWARIMAQVVYYFQASLALGAPARPVRFVVPTGNFGDVYAGYVAHRMGLPVERLVVATNRNDILTRFFDTGVYRKSTVAPTISPSMDIQVASNFERLLFELCERDGAGVRALMDRFAATGSLELTADQLAMARHIFEAYRVDEEATYAAIAEVHASHGVVIDPHTAVAVAAGRRTGASGTPRVVLATAHPAKFEAAVARAIGFSPDPPARLSDLFGLPERFDVVENDLATVERYVEGRAHLGRNLEATTA